MRLHAEILSKGLIAAGACIEVAALRTDDTHVALSELLEAGVAIPLAEAFFGSAAALKAGDPSRMRQGYL